MSTPVFQTPANIKDFKDPSSYQKWSDWISGQNDANIQTGAPMCSVYAGVLDRYPGISKSQYYNPEHITVPKTQDAPITWGGFPRRIQIKYPPNSVAMYKEAENAVTVKSSTFLQHYFDNWQPYTNTLMRVQDEYLEWFPHLKDGKLVRVDFTCEGPEYWQNMHDWEPDTLVKLYRTFVNPAVQLQDLQWVDPGNPSGGVVYNPYNKWNTTQGLMHLNCPPNSLGAEINLAAFATVLHGADGVPITDPQALINCAQYGNAQRNSDPSIGAGVNGLCAQGYVLTCTNPVGLYIQEIDTSSWYRNNAPIPQNEIDQIVTIERGTPAPNQSEPGRILRVKVEVPASLGYQLSDITVNATPLQYGGQLAFGITMNLAGTYGTQSGVGAQPLQACLGQICPNGLNYDQAQLAAAAHAKAAAHRAPHKHKFWKR